MPVATPKRIAAEANPKRGIAASNDWMVVSADYWSPREFGDSTFGTRRLAHQLMGITVLDDASLGPGANVVLVDQGFAKTTSRRRCMVALVPCRRLWQPCQVGVTTAMDPC
jgi:hypothetical protein